MKNLISLILVVIMIQPMYASKKNSVRQQELVQVPSEHRGKILSGLLIEKISQAKMFSEKGLYKQANFGERVILYFKNFPDAPAIQALQNLGVVLFRDTWTPPLPNHPLGFMLAEIPVNHFNEIVAMDVIYKLDTAERVNNIKNNDATMSVRANMVWDDDITGSGVKIGILDSGLDISFTGADLPGTIEVKDYSEYPDLDDEVANTVTGHGTHVAATALGRGVFSEGHVHWNNGKGSFKGAAPAADLCFLKIGLDSVGWAEDAAMIAAIDAAVNVYGVDLISVSYGGWDAHHDGSGALDQKADWAYLNGVPFFCSAGNSADDYKHWSGIIAANSESDFIAVEAYNASELDTRLRFNLVWFDGEARNELTLHYFDSDKQPITNITRLPVTESTRGSESQYSYHDEYVPAGTHTYYLKIQNLSATDQFCHIYEDWSQLIDGNDKVYFYQNDPAYTIGSPATADYAFAVGAYVSKVGWTDPTDGSWWYGPSYIINNLAKFSSRGPRNDGIIKPDICAPGHLLVSLRDTDVYTTQTNSWIDNDGIMNDGEANYYQMRGTSMACPVVAGAAALYLEAHPGAAPFEIYQAIKSYSNKSGLNDLPNNDWGWGKLDIFSAIKGSEDPIVVDGVMDDERYQVVASYTSGRDGFGAGNDLGELKYYCDGTDIYIGITGEVTSNDNFVLFMDFSGYEGKGSSTLGGGNADSWVYNVFAYLVNVKMDFDVDFALGFNEGNSTQYEFYTDLIRYADKNLSGYGGKTNWFGARSTFDAGEIFGGIGKMSVAYDSCFCSNPACGVEMRIPITAFAGVDTTQTLRLFTMISSMNGHVSNECMPGDPGADNPGDGVDFSSIDGQDFFTEPLKLSGDPATSVKNEELVHSLNRFSLEQNYPNPFNPSTNITYHLNQNCRVDLSVYNTLGQRVDILLAQKQAKGTYTVSWNAESFPAGVYFCYLKTDAGQSERIKMVVLK